MIQPKTQTGIGRLLVGLSLLLVVALATASMAAGTSSNAAAPGVQQQRPAVGETALDFSLESLDGTVHSLGDLRGDKRAILIFFRGTW